MKIVISGYYGYGNAGDELILESIVNEVRSRDGNAAITVLSAKPEQTAGIHGIRAVNRWNWLHIVRKLRSADMLVSGGGGLFQDMTGSLSLYYYLLIILLAKLLGKKTFIYGVGVNHLKPLNRLLTVSVLRHTDCITVREEGSRELLVSWGCPPAKIEVTADPVLLKEVPFRSLKTGKPRVVFILRPPRRGKWPVELFAQVADSISQRLSAEIVFVPFHLEYDLQFTLAVMRAMRSPGRLVQWTRFQELYGVLKESDLVISQRLHGLILAVLHGLPLVGISADPKIDRFMRELGQKNIANIGDINHYYLLAVILDVWEWREDFRNNACKLLPAFKNRARRITDLLLTEFERE